MYETDQTSTHTTAVYVYHSQIHIYRSHIHIKAIYIYKLEQTSSTRDCQTYSASKYIYEHRAHATAKHSPICLAVVLYVWQSCYMFGSRAICLAVVLYVWLYVWFSSIAQDIYVHICIWTSSTCDCQTFGTSNFDLGCYRVSKTHRMPYLYRSFSAKEPYT